MKSTFNSMKLCGDLQPLLLLCGCLPLPLLHTENTCLLPLLVDCCFCLSLPLSFIVSAAAATIIIVATSRRSARQRSSLCAKRTGMGLGQYPVFVGGSLVRMGWQMSKTGGAAEAASFSLASHVLGCPSSSSYSHSDLLPSLDAFGWSRGHRLVPKRREVDAPLHPRCLCPTHCDRFRRSDDVPSSSPSSNGHGRSGDDGPAVQTGGRRRRCRFRSSSRNDGRTLAAEAAPPHADADAGSDECHAEDGCANHHDKQTGFMRL